MIDVNTLLTTLIGCIGIMGTGFIWIFKKIDRERDTFLAELNEERELRIKGQVELNAAIEELNKYKRAYERLQDKYEALLSEHAKCSANDSARPPGE